MLSEKADGKMAKAGLMPKSYNKGNRHNAKPDADRASCRIAIRCKRSDKQILEAKANKAGLTLSQYILSVCLSY